MWQVKLLKETRSTASFISLVPERHFSNEMGHMLMANAASVNLFDANRYFLYLASWVSKIVGNDKFHRIVVDAFLSRSLNLYYQSKHLGNTNKYLQKLDLLERRMFKLIKSE